MNADLEQKFAEIGETAIQEAEQIECSLETFLEGLELIEGAIRSRAEQVRDEIRANNEAES